MFEHSDTRDFLAVRAALVKKYMFDNVTIIGTTHWSPDIRGKARKHFTTLDKIVRLAPAGDEKAAEAAPDRAADVWSSVIATCDVEDANEKIARAKIACSQNGTGTRTHFLPSNKDLQISLARGHGLRAAASANRLMAQGARPELMRVSSAGSPLSVRGT